MTITAILVLAVGTYAFRVAGPLLRARMVRARGGGDDRGAAALPPRLTELMSTAGTVLLVALIATAALTDGGDFAGVALPAGVLTGGVLAWRRVPFVFVVFVAAAVAAGLRALGVP
ncbi:MAG: AzlD domain-containing protein [Actinophytocola sp.]|uniref:AzlD domain-containing protein n=1 Tax=Actinophytocola sp. TaxID=1872138 RepID=UPI001321D024|nr:AzlD domain-containing protein [Actinophytocola sp.]MPZ80059.1 AzlD domain-containing protein [Actinophytocola sp.]